MKLFPASKEVPVSCDPVPAQKQRKKQREQALCFSYSELFFNFFYGTSFRTAIKLFLCHSLVRSVLYSARCNLQIKTTVSILFIICFLNSIDAIHQCSEH